MKKAIIAALILATTIAISLLVTAGIVWAVCWGFGLTFRWRAVVAVWAVWLAVESLFKGNKE